MKSVADKKEGEQWNQDQLRLEGFHSVPYPSPSMAAALMPQLLTASHDHEFQVSALGWMIRDLPSSGRG